MHKCVVSSPIRSILTRNYAFVPVPWKVLGPMSPLPLWSRRLWSRLTYCLLCLIISRSIFRHGQRSRSWMTESVEMGRSWRTDHWCQASNGADFSGALLFSITLHVVCSHCNVLDITFWSPASKIKKYYLLESQVTTIYYYSVYKNFNLPRRAYILICHFSMS